MKRLGPVCLIKSEKKLRYASNKKQLELNPSTRLMRIRASDRYKYFLRSLPNGTRVPCALMKIGIITGDIQAETHSIQVIRDQEKIEGTPTADLSPRMLSEFRRYMSHLHENNNLLESDKKCIGSIITVSSLGTYPKNAGDFNPVVSDKKQYHGICVKSYTDKYDLDEIETISQKNIKEMKSKSPPPEEEIRKHREAVQDDVELDKI